MARRRRQDRNVASRATGVVRARVRPRLELRQVPVLAEIEDRRLFHPEGRFAPALTFSRRDQRRIVLKTKAVSYESSNPFLSPRVAFAVPGRVAVCVRRKQRREVIHAKGLVKRGAGAGRRRRTAYSDVDCR